MRFFLVAGLCLSSLWATSAQAQSCAAKCGGPATSCWCDAACLTYGDCCADYTSQCRVPDISSVSPAALPTTGGTVTLTGARFSAAQGTGAVTVGASSCVPSSWSETAIVCAVPAGTGANLTASVTSREGTTGTRLNAFSFQAPVLSGLTPRRVSTAGGTAVTIAGANFGAGGAQVRVGAATAVVNSQTHTQLVVLAPEGEGACSSSR